MSTAVRRLLIIACVVSTMPLLAQTTKKTTTKPSTPQPATVTTEPAEASVEISKADQAMTVAVSAGCFNR